MVFLGETITEKKWYALNTRCHHEKQVAIRLDGKGVGTFLPTRTINRRWKDRRKLVDFPLFPGYLFIHMTPLEKRQVIQTPGVVRIVGTHRPEPVAESQLIAVRRFIETEIEFDPYPYLVPGIEVEVIRGPLKNVRGTLEVKKNKHRLIINIEMINNSVATEIDADDVQPV